jgi:hypothetical protein
MTSIAKGFEERQAAQALGAVLLKQRVWSGSVGARCG